ncbi:MAG: BolA family protein [Rhodoferax sp.]
MTSDCVSSAPTAQSIEQRLRERLQPTVLEVIDESFLHKGHAGANGSGFGSHFRIRITSHRFTGLPAVLRHRLVYDALQDFMDQGLHALAIEARPPSA